ncbi:molecular chaperone Skp [Megamonas hypermegale]|uniref:OmpH family outer membrane protein n=1 Tax=Megamonas hypermegale TaxID=158847 RepID=UPI000B38BA26|nr:OmpH family outer membrane protein [Megamonas hypermegale]OUO40250.1 molecular chaperone Skp [Megamonas hypermegale]HJG07965.1 OmpH family outer membrane protein [Megamonas hypermegale]
MINFQKKQVKIISVIIAAVFIFSIVALGVSQYQSGMAGASSSNVGIVDYSQLISQHPGMQAAREKYEEAAKQVQDEFSQKAGSMTPEQQQQFIEQKQKEMQDKQKELLDPIRTSIETQVQSVADSRGINVVLDKNNVLYGGQDITQEVLQKLQAEGDTTSSDATADTTTTDSTATTENSATTETSGEATNTAQ